MPLIWSRGSENHLMIVVFLSCIWCKLFLCRVNDNKYCGLNYDVDQFISYRKTVECSSCTEWFHRDCEDIPQSAFDNLEEEWNCRKCSMWMLHFRYLLLKFIVLLIHLHRIWWTDYKLELEIILFIWFFSNYNLRSPFLIW